MADLAAIFITSYIVGLSGALMPGPVSAIAVSESARCGFRAGPLVTVGHAIAEVAIVAALAMGLSSVLQHRFIAATIGLLGGAFLMWMGAEMAVSAWQGRVSLDRADASPSGMARLGLVPAGVFTSLANPYWFLWWATVGASYILLSLRHGVVGLAAFYGGHISADLGWHCLLAFAATSGRRAMGDKAYRAIVFICGLFLVGMSFYFIMGGIKFVRG